MVCNSAYDLGLKSKIWPRPGAVAQDVTAGHAARLFVTEIFEAKQEVCLKLLQDLRGLQRR